ncbi:MAG: S8 family serine peptidase [Candidatus Hodarchaeota archaeon]
MIYPYFLKKIENKEGNIPDKEKAFRVIISFDDIPKRDNFLSKHTNLRILKTFDIIPSINLYLTFEQIKSLEKEKSIKNIEEDQRLYLSILEVNEILDLSDYRMSQISYTGKNVKIGIIDNGINKTFDSISDIELEEFQFIGENLSTVTKKTDITHATTMASIIGNLYKDNYNNFIGIAPNAKYIDFDISVSDKKYYLSNILEVFDLIYSQNIKLDILLISFTTSHPSDGNDILSLACNLLVEKGIIIVCPAGNSGPDPYSIGSPSAAKKVITIGSLSKSLTISNFSSRGPTLDERPKPDFCLPGSKIEVPLSDKLGIRASGTSVSAAFCVGIIALLKEFNQNISYNEILDIMQKASSDLSYDKNSQGYGIINIVSIFQNLDLYQEKILPYKHLIKRAFKFTIEFAFILVLIYYIVYFFSRF